MNLQIEHCGSNSIVGAIYDQVYAKGHRPDVVNVAIEVVMGFTCINRELQKARETYACLGLEINVVSVEVDLYKEQLSRNPLTVNFS